MRIFLFSTLVLLPSGIISACAPGKGGAGGGIGCSKTSSVLKTPTIVKADSETIFDPEDKVSPDEQRQLFYKHFGQFKANNTGGYLYIQSRAANDVLGSVAQDAEWKRCSALLEFPKRTGELRAPSVAGSAWNGKTVEQIEADRFPLRTDPLKVRIYSAAHCFDYSTNERVVLSAFSVIGQNLPSFPNAYENIELNIPELEAIKNLRTSLKNKIASGALTSQNAIDILKAFQPATQNMRDVFGLPSDGSIPTSPTARQNCLIPPADTGDAKQYSCGTYHDLIVLDVNFTSLPEKQDKFMRDLRDNFVVKLKKTENERVDPVNSTGADVDSPWKDYATEPEFRLFLGNALRPECDDFTPVTTSTPGSMYLTYSSGLSGTNLTACQSNLYPANPGSVVGDYDASPGSDISHYPRIYTIKLSCKGVAAPECDEVPINSMQNLHYMRYTTRERLRNFSRYNMVGSLPNVPAGLRSCGTSTAGICAAKDDVQSALTAVAPGLTLGDTWLNSAADFSSNSSPYGRAENQVDGALDVWKDFFAANDEAGKNATPTGGQTIAGTALNNALIDDIKKLLNPINFLNLHSNFIVQDRALETLPNPADMDLRRAFLNLPINNIIGLDKFSSFTADSNTDPRPIFIDTWNSADGSGKGGRFLRFWTTKNQLNSYLDNSQFNSSFGDHFSPTDPNSYFVLFDKPTIDPNTDPIAKIPTQATLQKGDSGSIFTLDGIPTFALSTVNGEPTSGGAAVRAIPVAGADTDDSLPGGGSVAANGPGSEERGGTIASSRGNICK